MSLPVATTLNKSTKRPPDSIIQQPPAKRPNPDHASAEDPPLLPSDSPLTRDQLRDSTPDELVDIIMHMQARLSDQFAHFSARCDTMSHEMLHMKESMSRFLAAQSTAMSAAATLLTGDPTTTPALAPTPTTSSAFPHQPSQDLAKHRAYPASLSTPSRSSSLHLLHRQTSPSPPPKPASVTQPSAMPTSQEPPVSVGASATPRKHSLVSPPPSFLLDTPPSNGHQTTKLRVIPAEDGGPPTVIYSSANTVRDVWAEYRHGVDGQPSIQSLDASWGPRWRPEPRGRTWYSRRKIIWDKIKELVYDGLSEEAAVAEIERIRSGRSMNWLMNILQNDRKEVKASWRAAAAAATAAKETTHAATPPQANGQVS